MKTLEIILSAAVAFSLGFVWYGLIFKDHWPKKMADNALQKRSKIIDYLLIYLAMCVIAYFMNNGCLETHINGGDLGHGIFHGGLYGLSYAIPIIAIHHIYQNKSIKQFFIDAAYSLIFFGAIGGMLAFLKLMVY